MQICGYGRLWAVSGRSGSNCKRRFAAPEEMQRISGSDAACQRLRGPGGRDGDRQQCSFRKWARVHSLARIRAEATLDGRSRLFASASAAMIMCDAGSRAVVTEVDAGTVENSNLL